MYTRSLPMIFRCVVNQQIPEWNLPSFIEVKFIDGRLCQFFQFTTQPLIDLEHPRTIESPTPYSLGQAEHAAEKI